MRDDIVPFKKRRFPKLLLPIVLTFVVVLVLVGAYSLRRLSRPGLVAPTSNASKEQLLRDSLNSAGLQFESPFEIDDETITASIAGTTVLFSTAKDLSIQVRSLQLLLPEVTMDKEKISVIDLRFNKVVIKQD